MHFADLLAKRQAANARRRAAMFDWYQEDGWRGKRASEELPVVFIMMSRLPCIFEENTGKNFYGVLADFVNQELPSVHVELNYYDNETPGNIVLGIQTEEMSEDLEEPKPEMICRMLEDFVMANCLHKRVPKLEYEIRRQLQDKSYMARAVARYAASHGLKAIEQIMYQFEDCF